MRPKCTVPGLYVGGHPSGSSGHLRVSEAHDKTWESLFGKVLDPLPWQSRQGSKTPRCWNQARVLTEGCSLSEKEEGAATCWLVSLWFYLGLEIAPSPISGGAHQDSRGAAGVPGLPGVH